METIVCNKCGLEKDISSFEFRKDQNKYRSTCKSCRYLARREKYQEKKDEINKKRRDSYQKNKDEINKKRRELYAETKDDYNVKRRKRNPKSKLREQLLKTINRSFERKGFERTKSYEELLCCSIDEAVEGLLISYQAMYHEEWDGIVKVHIDHLVPLVIARNVYDVEKLCHTGNLCLLTQKDNIRKGSRLNDGISRNGKMRYIPYYYLDHDDFFDSESEEG